MAYRPKRLINNNLYTAGGEYYIQSTGEPYTGPYHQDYNGAAYTGATPNDPNKRPLVLNPATTQPPPKVIRSATNSSYANLNPKNDDVIKFGKDPISFTPSPTTTDYDKGTITRYFAKKRNDKSNNVREINDKAYGSLISKDGDYNYTTWKVTSLKWKISGNQKSVESFNQSSKVRANRDLKGIGPYLSNNTQFYNTNVTRNEEDVDAPPLPRRFNRPPRRSSGGSGSNTPRPGVERTYGPRRTRNIR